MKSVIGWFAENHVAANLLMLFLLLAGAVNIFFMKIEVFPEAATDRISITALYPGASPAEIEESVVRKIEESVAGLSGIKNIDATAREGFGSVLVEVMKGWDVKDLLDKIKAEVDRITTFPNEMEKPVVSEITQTFQTINVAVFGDVPERTLKNLSQQIKDDLTNLPGITLAQLSGVRKSEIQIEVSERMLQRYRLTLGAVADAVRRGSFDLPAGSIKTKSGEILIRTKGRRYYAKDYSDIPVITRPDGTRVTLGQIADLKEAFEDVDLITEFQGKPAAVIQVFRVADQNALDVAQKTRTYIEKIRPTLPNGVQIDFYHDMTKILKGRLKLLMNNLLLGLVLVSVFLGIVLNIRLAFWVTLGIPISFMTAFWLLPEFSISINMISLFAFILVLGIVVDDAIIIGENIFRKQELGLKPLEAAQQGAMEVGVPVIFSVLTTMVAFYPLTLAASSTGKIIGVIPVVVILVLLGSLIEALFILPSHLSRSRHIRVSRKGKTKYNSFFAKWLHNMINGPYLRLVNFSVKWRYVTVSIALASLIIVFGVVKGGWIKFTFMPEVESDVLICAITMPSETPFERTIEVASRVEKGARVAIAAAEKNLADNTVPLLEQTVTTIGVQMGVGQHGPQVSNSAGYLAQVFIQLSDGEKRDISAARLCGMWRDAVGVIPDAESIIFQSDLFSPGKAIEVHLSMDDHHKLINVADQLKEELSGYPGVFDVADSFLPGKPEMQLQLKPGAQNLGLTLNDLALQVRHAFYGVEALRIQRDKDEVKVMVRYPKSERRSRSSIEEMKIRTIHGVEVPFRHVAKVKMKQSYATIERSQRRRVIKVSANVDETVSNAKTIRDALKNKVLDQLVRNNPGLHCSMEGEAKEQRETFGDVIKGFVIALFGIYILLAIPFKSYVQPIVVMVTIPFGIVGAISGHLLMGVNLSILSIFGVVGLSGVVVNDALVLIHTANRLRYQEGKGVNEAVTQAGALRFRPIILTSLTTFVGLMPMIFEQSFQARFLIPMTISLGFGVLFATVITLIIVPCIYMILEDFLAIIQSIQDAIFGGGVLSKN